MKPVPSITDVTVSMLKSNPPQLEIDAKGYSGLGVWEQAHLSVREYVTPPADGFQEIDMIGNQVSEHEKIITNFDLTITIQQYPDWLKGVRVRGAENFMEAMLSK